jgi:hypothetical protein
MLKTTSGCRSKGLLLPIGWPAHLTPTCRLSSALLFRLQEGEDPVLSHPITENLNAVLQLLQYREVGGGRGGVGGEIHRQKGVKSAYVPVVRWQHQHPALACLCGLFSPPTTCCALQVRELSLSANQLRSEMESRRLRFAPGDSLTNSSWLDAGGGPGGAGQLRSASEMRGRADLPAKIEAAELQRLRAGAEIIDCRGERLLGGLAGACAAAAAQ